MKASLALRMLAGGLLALLAAAAWAQAPTDVGVRDTGAKLAAANFECKSGHQVLTQSITLDTGKTRYAFTYRGCQDPAHGDLHPSAEGNFGMPEPWVGNWYWGGFLEVMVNGTDALKHKLSEMRIIETGARGAFQAVWTHPDAIVALRIMALPGLNHVLCDLSWKPKSEGGVKQVAVRLRCYPSFFTTSRQRQGDRHCQTPRTDQKEGQTLTLTPGPDTYLYYYDTVFDRARGEGEGPCVAVLSQDALTGGKVVIGGYSEETTLDLKPEAGHYRFALYDFTGSTNAEAEGYLKAKATEDLSRLLQADFRPQAVQAMDLERYRAEAVKLLADAADDGLPFKPGIDELLNKVGGLKTRADAGDWSAEADMAEALLNSEDVFWRLKCFAVLNNPPQ